MRRVRTFLCLVFCAVTTSLLAQTPQQAFDMTSPAVVKLRVNGNDPNDRSKPTEEGTGFIIFSDKGVTLIITAAHVIGSSQTIKEFNPDWLVNDLDKTIKRTIKVDALDSHGILAERSASAVVVGQDDARDIAVLSIQGTGFRRVQVLESILDLQGSLKPVLVLGYEKGQRTIGVHSGRGMLGQSARLGFGFALDVRVAEGRSGGPVVDEMSGRVVGVASQNIGSFGKHEAVPVAFAVPILNLFFQTLKIYPEQVQPRTQGRVVVSLPDTVSDTAKIMNSTVTADFRIYEEDGAVYLDNYVRGSHSGYWEVDARRTINVSTGVDPGQGKCWEIGSSAGAANVRFWTEACSSGLHCRRGRHIISVAGRSKVPNQVLKEWFSGTWYQTDIPC